MAPNKTLKLMLRRLLISAVLLLSSSPLHAAVFQWSAGGRNLVLDTSQATRCTLVVAPDPNISAFEGYHILWCGDGSLKFASSVDISHLPYSADRTPTPSDRADAASNREHLDLGARDRSATLTLVVSVLSGRSFDITLVEVSNKRALRWPLDSLPVVTINGGVGRPVHPIVFSATPSLTTDSVGYWLTGLGLSRAKRVLSPYASSQRALAFAAFGDTAIRVSIPIAQALQTRDLLVFDSAGLSSLIEADARASVPRPSPARMIAILRAGAPVDALAETEGVAASRRLGPTSESSSAPEPQPASVDLKKILVVDVAEGRDAGGVLAGVKRNPYVASAGLATGHLKLHTEPNDQLWGEQWGLHQVWGSHCNGTLEPLPNSSIGLPEAWDYPPFPPPVYVSILDTGVNAIHEDIVLAPDSLNASFWGLFADVDAVGHGTAVASIAAASTNNSLGMAGAASLGVPASVKMNIDDDVSVLDAMAFAALPGSAPIINMSWGGEDQPNDPDWEAFKRALLKVCKTSFMNGHLLIGSAGNDHDSVRSYPAAFDEYVTAVGATLWNNLYWTPHHAWPERRDSTEGTRIGSWVDVVAPGGLGIVAAWGLGGSVDTTDLYVSGYWTLDEYLTYYCNVSEMDSKKAGFGGTSASAPLVAGTAAWLKKVQPTLTGEDLAQVLRITATDMGQAGRDVFFANGRVNAAAAAALVSRPNWVEHGLIGDGSDHPLQMAADSAVGTIAISWAGDQGFPDNTYPCVRYHLVGVAPFSGQFEQVPKVWVRRSASRGLPLVSSWDEDQQPPWAAVTALTAESGSFETYVYRLTGFGNRFFPCPPQQARIAYTAIAPSQTLSVPIQAGVGLTLSVRTRRSPARFRAVFDVVGLAPGPVRAEVFDVAGRRMATLFEGSHPGGRTAFEWDGRMQGAGICRAGMYICRVEQPDRRSACRFAFLR